MLPLPSPVLLIAHSADLASASSHHLPAPIKMAARPQVFPPFLTQPSAQAETVRKAEEERMKQEAKETALRAAKERLDRLQATWREDQHLKEVCSPSPVSPPLSPPLQTTINTQISALDAPFF